MSWLRRAWPEVAAGVIAAGMLAYGAIQQFPHYHDFADARTLFGIPRALDVLSNAGFLVVGVWGVAMLLRSRPAFGASWPGYLVFALAVGATAFGSGWYHLAPDDTRLVWDRVPIAIACAGLLAAVHADTHEDRHPWRVVVVLVALACASVWWWTFTAARGVGDLRPYLYLQAIPLLLIPAWQAIAGSPRRERIGFAIAILLYALAKIFELGDHQVFDATGFVSGHTVKHLLATAASAVIIGAIAGRSRAPRAQTAPRSPARAAS